MQNIYIKQIETYDNVLIFLPGQLVVSDNGSF